MLALASGTDDVASVTPSAIGVATSIGTRGLTLTLSDTDFASLSASASAAGVSDADLVAGQVWTIAVTQNFTATTATSGGTYESSNDTTYIVEVTKGGLWADNPEVSVSTTNGIDQSGPHVVSDGVDVAIGTDSVTINLKTSAGLSKGDRFYIVATGVTDGRIGTIELGTNLDQTYADGDEVGIQLYIRKPKLEVSANRTGYAPLVNWSQTETEISVKDGIIAYDESWTDAGVALPLDVTSSSDAGYGKLYVEYRAWLSDLCNAINSIVDVGDIEAISGPLHPDNELKWGVYKALQNSNGTPVLYTAVCDPNDVDEWDDVFEILLTRDDTYNLYR